MPLRANQYHYITLIYTIIYHLLTKLAVRFLKVKPGLSGILRNKELILIALIPVIWFMAAAQPTVNHHWFQYRGIAVSFWAAFVYLQHLLTPAASE